MAAWLLTACDGALVGGGCLEGYANEDGVCVREDDLNVGGAGAGGSDQRDVGIRLTLPVGSLQLGSGGASDGGGGADATSTAGHVVALGFDPAESATGRTMLTNAALLSLHDPVRVLSLTGRKPGSSIASLQQTVSAGAASRGRGASFATAALALSPPQELRQRADVLLVSGRSLEPHPAVASGWSDSLGAFVADGGVLIVVADGGSGAVSAAFLADTDVMPTLEAITAPAGELTIVAWTDALAVGATTPFSSTGPTTAFALPDDHPAARVVFGAGGALVAIHSAIAPQ
jgi:hypothetical protein